jgi:hypothetical protein
VAFREFFRVFRLFRGQFRNALRRMAFADL